jgi:hypothetical protein
MAFVQPAEGNRRALHCGAMSSAQSINYTDRVLAAIFFYSFSNFNHTGIFMGPFKQGLINILIMSISFACLMMYKSKNGPVP